MSGQSSGISDTLDNVGGLFSGGSPYTFSDDDGSFDDAVAELSPQSGTQPQGGVVLAAAEPNEEDEDVAGWPLSMQEEYNTSAYYNDYRELKQLDPNNPEFGPTLRPQNWVPSDSDVQRVNGELAAAKASQQAQATGQPSYVPGASDGGPGRWVANSPKIPVEPARRRRLPITRHRRSPGAQNTSCRTRPGLPERCISTATIHRPTRS